MANSASSGGGMNSVTVTKCMVGIYGMQVCVAGEVDDDTILEVCNRENPSGTTNGWMEVARVDSEYAPGPVRCKDDPERTHFIVIC